MTRLSGLVLAGLLVLVCGACGSGTTLVGPTAGSERAARLERMAGGDPAELLARIHRAYDERVMRARVVPSPAESGGRMPYTLVAARDAWRVEMPATAPDGGGAEDDGAIASLLAVDGELCFDRAFRPLLSAGVEMSYGQVAFDPEPWTCTPAAFGLNRLATFSLVREDPRWRIESLATEDPGVFVADVEQVDGEPLLHVRTTGVTRDGPLDPERPVYDLWIDEDHLPVRMETEGLAWELDYPAGLERDLVVPAADQRGSYGYLVGPGQAQAKACRQGGHCPEPAPARLTWGDGR